MSDQLAPLRPGTITSVIWSGIALASDGYNSQVLSAVNVILGKLYKDEYTSHVRSRVSTAYYVGVCLGAVFFGSFIDRVSRKAGVLSATIILILGVGLCAGSSGTSINGMFWMLTVCRGILGFGAGGEYPVSSTAATEAGNETPRLQKIRGLLVGLVGCTSIDLGIVFGGLLPLIILAGYGYNSATPASTIVGLHVSWRLMIALGAIVPASVFYFRWRMASSSAFEKHGRRHHFSSAFWIVVIKTYWLRMIGTCLTWALYNAVAYPFGLFTATIVDQLSGGQDGIIHSIGFGTLVNAFLIPGCLLGSWLLDRLGRRNTQIFGFASSAMLAFILGGALLQIQTIFPLFIVMYGILLALLEAGPGVGTILISAECYPTAIRGHCVGLSAAFGKAGAAIGVVAFGAIQDRLGEDVQGQRGVFLVGAAFSLLGALVTLICIPKISGNLEDEDHRFQQILADNNIREVTDEQVPEAFPHLGKEETIDPSPSPSLSPSVDEKQK